MDDNFTTESDRRLFLKRAGVVAGTTVWATPVIQSIASPAFATGSPTPECPPENYVRFKFDINDSCTGGVFNSGDAGGPAADCLGQIDAGDPAGANYYDTTKVVNANGCYGTACVQIALTCTNGEADTAKVTVTNGGQLLDVNAKAAGRNNLECKDAQDNGDGTFTADLTKGISFVAGVFCVPTPG